MAVGESCLKCGGVGHYARECPTSKGKGKSQGKGKAAGKGWSAKGKSGGHGPAAKGGGKGKSAGPMFGSCFSCGGAHFARECPKGGGKGGKGTSCATCGGKGHRAEQCPSQVSAVEQGEEEDQEDTGVHSVWQVSEVRREAARSGRWRMKREQRETPSYASMVSSAKRYSSDNLLKKNRFAALQADDDDDGPVAWIQGVASETQGKWVGTTEIVVDSAADESVCPWGWAKPFKTVEVAPERQMKLKNASGGHIQHWGEKQVSFVAGDRDNVMGMNFQVCDVQRPLAAVCRIVDKGNIVKFGPRVEDNYILNPGTQEKIMLRRKGRSFVLDAELVKPEKALAMGFGGQGS